MLQIQIICKATNFFKILAFGHKITQSLQAAYSDLGLHITHKRMQFGSRSATEVGALDIGA